jgi:hypothetical protein
MVGKAWNRRGRCSHWHDIYPGLDVTIKKTAFRRFRFYSRPLADYLWRAPARLGDPPIGGMKDWHQADRALPDPFICRFATASELASAMLQIKKTALGGGFRCHSCEVPSGFEPL